MRLVVRPLDGFPIGRLDQTECGTARLIEPVGQKFHIIFFLKREILLVRIRKGVASRSFNVMAIHVDRHISTRMLKTALKL